PVARAPGDEPMMTQEQAFLVLNALPNIGPITLNRILAEMDGDPRRVFAADPARLERVKGVGPVISRTISEWKIHFDLEREEERLRKAGVAFVTSVEPGYPSLLREINDPPIGLYRKGNYDFT